MVKSKKMSKGSLAVIILAVLLVLSMIMGLTGAWFTSKAEKDGTTEVAFGKVAVAVDGTINAVKCTEDTKVVDGCSWTINGATLTTASTVDMYYMYSVDAKVLDSNGAEVNDETVKGYFTITGTTTSEQAILWENGKSAMPTLADVKVVFNSKGTMNGSTETYKIKVTVSVKAIQAAHITGENPEQKVANATTMLNNFDTINS